MKGKTAVLMLLALTALIRMGVATCAAAEGFEYPPEKRGDTVVRLRVEARPASERQTPDSLEIRLADELLVEVTLIGPATLEVKPGMTASDIFRSGSASSWAPTKDRVCWQETLRLEPRNRGEALLSLSVRLRENSADNRWEEVIWKPIKVHIATEIAQAELSQLRDIAPPEEVPQGQSWYHEWFDWCLWIGTGVVLLALITVIWRRACRAAPPRILPPETLALRELDRIVVLGLPAKGQAERYHTLISDVVRRYLEQRFQIQAPRQTTVEFLEAMRIAPQLSAAQQALLREFLGRCDLAKFGRAEPAQKECQELADQARSFVLQSAAPAEMIPTAG